VKDISMITPVTVTLRAAEWAWLLGLLSSVANQGDVEVLDKLYAQIMEATE
jgi:hypothetical protein